MNNSELIKTIWNPQEPILLIDRKITLQEEWYSELIGDLSFYEVWLESGYLLEALNEEDGQPLLRLGSVVKCLDYDFDAKVYGCYGRYDAYCFVGRRFSDSLNKENVRKTDYLIRQSEMNPLDLTHLINLSADFIKKLQVQ